MTIIYIGIYTLFLIVIWGFFIVAKVHAYKFKTFSHSIQKATFFLMILLLSLSVLGYIALLFSGSGSSFDIQLSPSNSNNEIIY